MAAPAVVETPAPVETPVAAPAAVETPAPPAVMGAQLSAAPAGQLPRTGTGTEGIALAGFASVLAGLGMTLTGRRRRQA